MGILGLTSKMFANQHSQSFSASSFVRKESVSSHAMWVRDEISDIIESWRRNILPEIWNFHYHSTGNYHCFAVAFNRGTGMILKAMINRDKITKDVHQNYHPKRLHFLKYSRILRESIWYKVLGMIQDKIQKNSPSKRWSLIQNISVVSISNLSGGVCWDTSGCIGGSFLDESVGRLVPLSRTSVC